MRTSRLMSHDGLRDARNRRSAFGLDVDLAPHWTSVSEPADVVGLFLTQDIPTADAFAAVREKLGPESLPDRRKFERIIDGRHEGSFAWLQYAARCVGLVLLPDAPKGKP